MAYQRKNHCLKHDTSSKYKLNKKERVIGELENKNVRTHVLREMK